MPNADREKQREYEKRYREKNGDAIRQRDRDQITNQTLEEKEKKNQYKREWATKNRERLRAYKREKSREEY